MASRYRWHRGALADEVGQGQLELFDHRQTPPARCGRVYYGSAPGYIGFTWIAELELERAVSPERGERCVLCPYQSVAKAWVEWRTRRRGEPCTQ